MNEVLELFSLLPLPVLYALGRVVYVLAYHVLRYRRSVVLDNLRRCFPDWPEKQLRRVARQFYRNLADVLAEFIKGHSMSQDELRRRVTVVDSDLVRTYIARGQNVVLVAAHHCNWEWLALAASAHLGAPVHAVYKRLHVRGIDRFVEQTRSRFGGHPVPVENFLTEVLKRGTSAHAFALVSDQTPPQQEEKYWTRFLGQDTAFYVGAEKIARLTRSPVVFVGLKRLRRGYYEAKLTLLVAPPYAGPTGIVTEPYARAVETQILESPHDWLWTHRKWKYDRPVYT